MKMVKLSDFLKICRLCAKAYRHEKLVKIFSGRGVSLNLRDSVNKHLPIKVTEIDAMPKNVCINCIRRLNATNEFLDTVLTSDKCFKRLLSKKERQSSTLPEAERKTDRLENSIAEANDKVNDSSQSSKNMKESRNREESNIDFHVDNNADRSSKESELISLTEKHDDDLKTNDRVRSESGSNIIAGTSFTSQSEHIVEQFSGLSEDHVTTNEEVTINLLTSELDILSNKSMRQLISTKSKSPNEKSPQIKLDKSEMQLRSNNDGKKVKYVNIVPKASHVLLNNGNCNGIVINVASSAACTTKDQHQKLPIEVLCCPDCNETVKIFTVEERQLIFEYFKQHRCTKIADADDKIKSFGKYKENVANEMVTREKNESPLITDTNKHTSSRIWPDGDLPADPGPDPALTEDIFEGEVRLDEDFHWPMPKRIRRLHKCTSCDFVTKSALRLKAHQKSHRTSDKKQTSHSTICKHCQKQFETIGEARMHERLAHFTTGAKISLCEYCGIMKPQKTLRDHVLKQHTVESEIDMQECDVCGKSFISPTRLYLHKKIHTIEKQHLCDLCGKAFKQRMAMRRHYMLHFPRAPPKFKCNICDKRVTTRGSLRLHMMRHTGEKPQECPECHMVMRHGLKHHMRLHSDDSPFKCVVCGADFKRRDYMRRHMRKHLNKTEHRTLQCTICGYVFDDIKNFLIHHRNVHSNEIFTQIKLYECKNCSMQFQDALMYKDHEELCKNSRREAPHKSCDNKVQSCITFNRTKVSPINVYKNVQSHVLPDRSHPCNYCDCNGMSDNNLVECRKKNTIENSLASALSEQRYDTQIESTKHQESNYKFNDDLYRLKKPHETSHHSHQHSEHVILSEDVMSLGTESLEYSYMSNIDKPILHEKNMLMSVDEQIVTSSSVHVFENPVDQFSQSSHSHPQSQLEIHSDNENYVEKSVSWKHL